MSKRCPSTTAGLERGRHAGLCFALDLATCPPARPSGISPGRVQTPSVPGRAADNGWMRFVAHGGVRWAAGPARHRAHVRARSQERERVSRRASDQVDRAACARGVRLALACGLAWLALVTAARAGRGHAVRRRLRRCRPPHPPRPRPRPPASAGSAWPTPCSSTWASTTDCRTTSPPASPRTRRATCGPARRTASRAGTATASASSRRGRTTRTDCPSATCARSRTTAWAASGWAWTAAAWPVSTRPRTGSRASAARPSSSWRRMPKAACGPRAPPG